MSLINDALKRANEQKAKQVSAQELGSTLQTVESGERETKIWPIAASVMMLFGSAWLGWSWWHGDKTGTGLAPIPVAAREAQAAAEAATEPDNAPAVASTAPSPASPPPGLPAPSATPAVPQPTISRSLPVASALPVANPAISDPASAGRQAAPPQVQPLVQAQAPASAQAQALLPNPAATTASSDPASGNVFPKLVLQGIYYRPSHPAAVINSKTLYVGDRVAQAKVLAIDRRQVTVQWNNEVRVLAIE